MAGDIEVGSSRNIKDPWTLMGSRELPHHHDDADPKFKISKIKQTPPTKSSVMEHQIIAIARRRLRIVIGNRSILASISIFPIKAEKERLPYY